MQIARVPRHYKQLILIILLLILLIPVLYPQPVLSYPGVIYTVPVDRKVVALTFDDGPHPEFTPQILAILERYKIKATFFMIGSRMRQYPDVVKEVSRAGMVIANHTYTHPNNLRRLSDQEVEKEIRQCQEQAVSLAGGDNHLFRPPRGLLDERIIRLLKARNYEIVFWSVSADHHDAPTPQMMAARVINQIQPGQIILLHDGRFSGRKKDVEATRLIIEALRKKGYEFVTIPQLLNMETEKTSNHIRA